MKIAFDLDHFLPYQLSAAAGRVSRAFAERYRDEFGITIPEWRVLAHLTQAEDVSVREIHLKVDMDKSKVSRAASRLEAAGYIAKRVNSQDKRLVALSLTPKGEALVKRILPVALAYQAELEERLDSLAPNLRQALDRLRQE